MTHPAAPNQEPIATESPSHSVSIRLPLSLHRELEALAHRDANTISAVAKRLIRAGLRQETEPPAIAVEMETR